MNKHVGGVANYKVSEEKAVEVTFRGNLDDTVIDKAHLVSVLPLPV